MKTTKFLSAVLAIVAGLSMASAVVAGVVTPTPILNAYYDPATGNIKLQNTTSASQSFQSFDIITLGNGSVGDPSGQPNNQGFLSTGTATMPTASFPVPNTSPFGYNGLYSQVGAANISASMFTLLPYPGWSETAGNQIGPVGSYWDLGNIAVLGMNQAQLDARFLTDPEGTPPNFDTTSYGRFLFSYQTGPTTFSVTTPGGVIAVAPIPEPSTIALAAVAATIGGVGAVSKRRKKASLAAKRLSTNA
jgi:hypothetical protein